MGCKSVQLVNAGEYHHAVPGIIVGVLPPKKTRGLLQLKSEHLETSHQTIIYYWLVLSTYLKSISQSGSFPQVGIKKKIYLKPPPRLGLFVEMVSFPRNQNIAPKPSHYIHPKIYPPWKLTDIGKSPFSVGNTYSIQMVGFPLSCSFWEG